MTRKIAFLNDTPSNGPVKAIEIGTQVRPRHRLQMSAVRMLNGGYPAYRAS